MPNVYIKGENVLGRSRINTEKTEKLSRSTHDTNSAAVFYPNNDYGDDGEENVVNYEIDFKLAELVLINEDTGITANIFETMPMDLAGITLNSTTSGTDVGYNLSFDDSVYYYYFNMPDLMYDMIVNLEFAPYVVEFYVSPNTVESSVLDMTDVNDSTQQTS